MKMAENEPGLKKVLKTFQLWGITVGLVISGAYFGWNYGWGLAGTYGFLIATFIATLLYVTFVYSFAELTTSIPHAGGPFIYAEKALGINGGIIAGYATLVEFIFAPPAIAYALSSYITFLYPAISTPFLPYILLSFFIILNFTGIKESAYFSITVTLIAIAEIIIYLVIASTHFKFSNIHQTTFKNGWEGIFQALPFAIWFYLAIEGAAMLSEEVKDPKVTIHKSFLYSLVTLVILTFSVLVFTAGIGYQEKLVKVEYPLPEAISYILGKENQWTKIFASVGIFGLVASLHGTIIAYSRQIFALSRGGYLPEIFTRLNSRSKVPHFATLFGGLIGTLSLITNTVQETIVLSALGAITLYIVSLISLFLLRKRQPSMDRPFKTPFYPYFPIISLIICTLSFLSIIYHNVLLFFIFIIGLLLLKSLFYYTKGKSFSKHI